MSKKRASKRKRRSPSAPQSLLILHLDAMRLHNDGLHLGDIAQFSGVLSQLTLGSRVVVQDATTRADLLGILANLTLKKLTFDVVVIVAHSNAEGIRLASDYFATWNEFAEYLKPLRPRRLLLAACRAGRWEAGEALFKANRNLLRIFACPVNASKDFAALMLSAVPYVVARRRPRDKDVRMSQVAAIAFTGRQLREWKRADDKGNPGNVIFDAIADALDPVAKDIQRAIGNFVRGKR